MEEVEGEVCEKSLRNGGNHGFLVPAKAISRTTGSLALELMQKRSRAEAMGVYWSVAGKAKWKFRLVPVCLIFTGTKDAGHSTARATAVAQPTVHEYAREQDYIPTSSILQPVSNRTFKEKTR
jgi:hypothetical protein